MFKENFSRDAIFLLVFMWVVLGVTVWRLLGKLRQKDKLNFDSKQLLGRMLFASAPSSSHRRPQRWNSRPLRVSSRLSIHTLERFIYTLLSLKACSPVNCNMLAEQIVPLELLTVFAYYVFLILCMNTESMPQLQMCWHGQRDPCLDGCLKGCLRKCYICPPRWIQLAASRSFNSEKEIWWHLLCNPVG